MTEMVDRMARAIFRIAPHEAVPRAAREAAQRGIAVMREPTAAMMAVGTDADFEGQDTNAIAVWLAMIDAALKEDAPESP